MSASPQRPFAASVGLLWIATACLLSTGEASAQESPKLLGTWPGKELRYRVNANFPGLLAGTAAQQLNLVRCAAAAWENQTRADFQLIYEGLTSIDQVENDGVNSIFWTPADGGGALASTLVLFRIGPGGAPTDQIASFDIAFYAQTNSNQITWSGPGEPTLGTTDISGVAIHEFGHAIGFDHADDSDATMFRFSTGGALGFRTLNETDRFWIESVYGTISADEPAVSVTSVEPHFGPSSGGSEVLVVGDNFTFDSETIVRLEGLAVSRSRWIIESCDRLRILDMPPRAEGSVDVTVENSIGEATLENGYRYGAARPTVNSVEPSVGPLSGGIDVTLFGSNFTEDVIALFGEQALQNQVFVDDSMIIGTLPAGVVAGATDVTLLFDGDAEQTLQEAFVYNAYELSLDLASAAPGSTGVSFSVLASSPEPIAGASFGLLYDTAHLSVVGITTENTDSSEADIALSNVDNAAGVATMELVLSVSGTTNIPAGQRRVLARALVDVNPSAPIGTTADISLENHIGSPPTLLGFDVVGPGQVTPVAFGGGLLISDGTTFVRGESNGDGTIDFSDAITILNFLFAAGDPGNCLKALDANDDGNIDVSDAIRVLTALFNGARAIPQPHPEAGLDPTPDELPCDDA